MKTFYRFSFILVSALLLVALTQTGCKKTGTEDLLTAHPWNFVKLETTSTDSSVINGITLANALMTGAVLIYNSDGTYSMSVLQQTQNGTWELSSDNKTLTMTPEGKDPDDMEITRLTDANLDLTSHLTDDEGHPYTTTLYWKK